MVPHGALEDALQRGLSSARESLAVTAVPDERRGERLVVLYTPEAGSVESLRRRVEESDLPNLWKPEPDAYVPVDALPFLGSGKLDLQKLRELAREAEGRVAA
jgi:acyl-[acyl-carrier-protein]-phospholipid O-acyltransferase/long-chain-fatty-acid--[acyl-carrier-protein] ligase